MNRRLLALALCVVLGPPVFLAGRAIVQAALGVGRVPIAVGLGLLALVATGLIDAVRQWPR